ncbi:unnamed protein product [Diatraea saccharalis]|uniref:Uncharacterized protein n=1 Tax=Diatraea saccharalis TaxID=40085 RepID=A0A9P0G014_9NEOP|nr:unnamed protein product [Diatraea saccharalis]
MFVSFIPEEYTDRVTKMIFGCRHLDTPDKSSCQRLFDVHKCSYNTDPEASIFYLFLSKHMLQ